MSKKRIRTETPAPATPASQSIDPGNFTPGHFQEIPITSISESATNPRKRFHGIDELAQNMALVGQLQPVVVRALTLCIEHGTQGKKAGWFVMPAKDRTTTFERATFFAEKTDADIARDAGQYELVCGARRYRAAKVAGLEVLQCIVRELNDKQVLEIQLVENCQRRDVHPLEEAEGYARLIDQHGYTAAALAERVGKSESYIHQRLALNRLIKPIANLFWSETITASHAVMCARLQEADQKEVLGWFKRDGAYLMGIRSARDYQEHIARELLCQLDSAAFPKADAELLPKAGPCTKCPKRTGFTPALWPEIKNKDTCTDRSCFRAKVAAFIDRQVKAAEASADGAEVMRISTEYSDYDKTAPKGTIFTSGKFQILSDKEGKKDAKASPAIIVHGDRPGRRVYVKPISHGSGSGGSAGDDKWARKQKAEQEKRKLQEQINVAVLNAIIEAAAGAPGPKQLRMLCKMAWDRALSDGQKIVAKRHKWQRPEKANKYDNSWMEKAAHDHIDAADNTNLHRFIVELCLAGHTKIFSFSTDVSLPDDMAAAAELYGVDPIVVGGDIRAQAKAKAAEKKAREKKAKKTKTKGKGKQAEADGNDGIADYEEEVAMDSIAMGNDDADDDANADE